MPQRKSGQAPLTTAVEAVGLLAAVVTVIYVLGGVILAIRLLFDGFSPESVIGLLGQLPREFVISAGLVQGVGPAVMIGTAAGIVFAATSGPRVRWDGHRDDRLDKGPRWPLTIAALAGLSIALAAPAIWLAASDDGLSTTLGWSLGGVILTFLLVCAGWFFVRRIGRNRLRYRLTRAFLGGLVWAGMAVVPAVMFGGAASFEPANVCAAELTDARTGSLVAQTESAVILALDSGEEESILVIPGDRVTQVQFGESIDEPCPAPETGG